MDTTPIQYAVLRDGHTWRQAKTRRLQQDATGALGLERFPGATLDAEVISPGPFEIGVSGLAHDSCRRAYLTQTANARLVALDEICGSRLELGGFEQPAGLWLCGGLLYVADVSQGAVHVVEALTLERRAIFSESLRSPTGVLTDDSGRIYVLDRGVGGVRRLSPRGVPDPDYAPELVLPAFFALHEGELYVSDASGDQVLRFARDGRCLGALTGVGAKQPRALATFEQRLFVADAAAGTILVHDLARGLDLGTVTGFRGPVSALALEGNGTLHVKTDLNERVSTLAATAGCATSGTLLAGPFDAGLDDTWQRSWVSADVPRGSRLTFHVALADSVGPRPAPHAWRATAALDTLLPPPRADGSVPTGSARYLWVEVLLESADGRTSPTLHQLEAHTQAPSYLEQLPEVYARRDAPTRFLASWLALFQAEINGSERLLDDMSSRFDPMTAEASLLPWLASWVAMELPHQATESESRRLVSRAHDIHAHRGTAAGVVDAVRRNTGLRPTLVEAYRQRKIWQLGESRLGLESGLLPALADGIRVPDPNEAFVVGRVIVGASGPLEPDDFGAPLFDEYAHRFSVILPAGSAPTDELRRKIRDTVDSSKPAHTDYHLCWVEPRFRVGFQARIGIDAIVAGGAEPISLNLGRVGMQPLGDGVDPKASSRVGERARLGVGTRLS